MAELEVIRAFSRASSSYEGHAQIQRLCARDLLEMMDMPAPRSVLEVGCGTGLFTHMLIDKFPDAGILACDPSQRMLSQARHKIAGGVEFASCGIGDLPGNRWELIVSNAALQWAGPQEVILPALKALLLPGGTLAFSYFTRNTYPELAEALSQAAGIDVKLACGDFASADEVEGEMSRLFTDVRVQRKVYTRNFADLRALLNHIKLTGTRGTGAQPGLIWTKGLLERTQQEYLSRFGCIRAGYEVVICTAK